MGRRWVYWGCLLLVLLGLLLILPASAYTDPSVKCSSLMATASTGWSYTFTAIASGNSNLITGYSFDFGDRQSYTVIFNQAVKTSRLTTTVMHTYNKPGAYMPQVHVNTQNNGKHLTVSSPACRTNVAIGPLKNGLPDTGVRNPWALFAFVTVMSTCMCQLWLRRRLHKP